MKLSESLSGSLAVDRGSYPTPNIASASDAALESLAGQYQQAVVAGVQQQLIGGSTGVRRSSDDGVGTDPLMEKLIIQLLHQLHLRRVLRQEIKGAFLLCSAQLKAQLMQACLHVPEVLSRFQITAEQPGYHKATSLLMYRPVLHSDRQDEQNVKLRHLLALEQVLQQACLQVGGQAKLKARRS